VTTFKSLFIHRLEMIIIIIIIILFARKENHIKRANNSKNEQDNKA